MLLLYQKSRLETACNLYGIRRQNRTDPVGFGGQLAYTWNIGVHKVLI